ncbi:MAG: glucose-6-phosphate dehydrogenase [Chloroflexi bacterium]|nr:glucose-6-phosphate dehydrogenase [Chloroflexota bacterium]MDA1220093.1 glucose-6-phosphate dehydrogenase [Chloroflexota bacterium]
MMPTAETTTLVIFGASGDLTHRKLVPALCSLNCKGRLPQDLNIVGVSRRPLSDDEFRASLYQGMQDGGEFVASPEQWGEFSRRIFYVAGDVGSAENLAPLQQRLAEVEGGPDVAANRLYYLALAPSLYEPAIRSLSQAKMVAEDGGWRRVVIEKPFGSDLTSAQKLNETVHSAFQEHQVFRIDHYLGKETVQNLMVFRFGNTIFEPIWNRNYIDHVQLTVAETVSVSERADYYDQAGVLRDMFQNHLLQLLTLVAMEPPAQFEADAMRNEKVKVLNAVRRISPEEAGCHTVHAQYNGYCDEEGVGDNSVTPTFAALRLYVDNWRWQGVPFYLRSGKALAEKATEIIIQFRRPPHMLFPIEEGKDIPANVLAICVQPDEGFHLEFQAKTPDAGLQMSPVDLEFHYQDAFDQAIPDSYERLLLDALNGDASLFIRSDEIEQSWGIIDPIIYGLASSDMPPPYEYEPGNWGPEQSNVFLGLDDRAWLRGCGEHKSGG